MSGRHDEFLALDRVARLRADGAGRHAMEARAASRARSWRTVVMRAFELGRRELARLIRRPLPMPAPGLPPAAPELAPATPGPAGP